MLNLHDMNLVGEISETLGKIEFLEQLHLSNNSLSGTVPVSLFELDLRGLYLQHNELSGDIPGGFVWSYLKRLDLSYNNLTGGVPQVLTTHAYQLEYLHLEGNPDLVVDSDLCESSFYSRQEEDTDSACKVRVEDEDPSSD